MVFTSTFRAAMQERHGERLQPRLTVRLSDGTETILSDTEHCLNLSPIRRRRERQFGVVQAQSWQATFSNASLFHSGKRLAGCYVRLDIGFPNVGLWQKVAVGKIRAATATTGNQLVVEVQEPLRELVDATLPRDVYFSDTGWLSTVQPERIDDDSQRYDGSPTASDYSQLEDETFEIEFLSATTFQVTDGDGNVYGPFNISSDASHGTSQFPLSTLVTIPSSGWSSDSGAYADGDIFVFYAAAPRAAADLTTIGMVRHLIEDVAAIEAYDFDADDFGTPLSDIAEWSRVEALVSTDTVEGEWSRGSRIIDMVQQLLKLSHASLYPTPDGKVAIWILEESGASAYELNADPARGDISLLSGSLVQELDECYGAVEYTYLALDGQEAAVRREASASETDAAGITLSVNVGWRVSGITVAAAVSKALNRFKAAREIYTAKTTLAGGSIGLAEGVTIHEPELDMVGYRSDTTEVALDVLDNSAEIEAWTDPVAIEEYGVIGTMLVGTGTVW